MNHPHDLLAGLVDGTLDAEGRAGVETHLRNCQHCRADLAAATAGRDAARSLGVVPAPPDLHERVVAAAGGGGGGRPGWYRWAAAAAAAAVVVGIALALPNVGNEPERAGSAGSGTASAEQAPAAAADGGGGPSVPLETQHRDYTDSALRGLAQDSAAGRAQPVSMAAAAKDGSVAVACIERSVGSKVKGQLIRLIEARFGGSSAYIAFYLEGPGAGQPADLVTYYVAATADCHFLSTGFADR